MRCLLLFLLLLFRLGLLRLFQVCGSSLTSALPLTIINGTFDFSNVCNGTNYTAAGPPTAALAARAHALP